MDKHLMTRTETTEMVDIETGDLKGFIPEELNIWVPPPKYQFKTNDISLEDLTGIPFKGVSLEGEKQAAALLFHVPAKWFDNRSKKGRSSLLSDIGWVKKKGQLKPLNQFVGLAEANPEEFHSFAKIWGPLWIKNNYQGEVLKDFPLAPWIEPIELWRMHVRLVKAVLDIASFLNQSPPQLASMDYWKTLFWHYEPYESLIKNSGKTFSPFDETRFDSIEKQQKEIMWYINGEMRNHSIKFLIEWENKNPTLKIGASLGFYSAVWFQLLQAVTLQSICLCDGCGSVYARSGRKPQAGRNNYCEECGTAKSKRDYERRNPNRKKLTIK